MIDQNSIVVETLRLSDQTPSKTLKTNKSKNDQYETLHKPKTKHIEDFKQL